MDVQGVRMGMRFKTAMNKRCPDCHSRAGHHRLTKKGALYCLALNKRGSKKRAKMDEYDYAVIHNISVKYLQRSTLPEAVGLSMREGMEGYL